MRNDFGGNPPEPLADKTAIYARPDGAHYHLNKKCEMLGRDFRRLGYRKISPEDVKRRGLKPCLCARRGYRPHDLQKAYRGKFPTNYGG